METKMNKKINTIGKAGRILATIAVVFAILSAIAITAGIGVTASLPKDALSVEVTGNADVTAKGEMLSSICDAIVDSASGGKGKITVGDSNIAVGDVENSVPEGVEAKRTDKGIALSVNSKRLDVNVNAIIASLSLTLVNTICTIVVIFIIRKLMKSLEKCETPFCTEVIKNMKYFAYSLIPLAVLNGTSENAWDSLLSMGISLHLGIDLKIVFGILVVFMLIMIFSYGAELQKQSDETL